MAAFASGPARPSSRYSSLDSSASTLSQPSSPSPPPSASRKNLSSLRRLVSNPSGRRGPADPMAPAVGDGGSSKPSSRALIAARPANLEAGSGHKVGSFVKKLMGKRSNKAGSSDAVRLVIPEDLKKTVAAANARRESNLTSLHRKLFQKGGVGGDRTQVMALTEVKQNTRTLAMVLRNERELLNQNAEYEAEISQLQLLLEEKDREVEKLKDLCLKQREEIKALKDAILFPDGMNGQLQVLLEQQGSELKQAKQVIPILQKQVTSLTGQLQWLAEDLNAVKADKFAAKSYFDGLDTSPRTPGCDHEASNSLEFSSEEQIMPSSPDDVFLEDLNPCLTPSFSKTKSKEYDEMMGYTYGSFGNSTVSNSDVCFNSLGGKLSKSSEHCEKTHLPALKTYRSDESKCTTKPLRQNPFGVW